MKIEHFETRHIRLPFRSGGPFGWGRIEWRALDLVSIDFFIVPTATLRVLFVFVALAHDRRRIVHCNVTEHPTDQWTAQQLVEAFPYTASICRAEGIASPGFTGCSPPPLV
jgi:hypothetical protein